MSNRDEALRRGLSFAYMSSIKLNSRELYDLFVTEGNGSFWKGYDAIKLEMSQKRDDILNHWYSLGLTTKKKQRFIDKVMENIDSAYRDWYSQFINSLFRDTGYMTTKKIKYIRLLWELSNE